MSGRFFARFLVAQPDRIYRVGDQLFERRVRRLAFAVEADDLHVGTELVEHLTARAAGPAVVLAAAGDDDALELRVSLAHRLERRGALGADGEAVAGVFDVAAGEHRAVLAASPRRCVDLRVDLAPARMVHAVHHGLLSAVLLHQANDQEN